MLEADEAANTFTVSIGENTGMVNLEDKVCVTYGGEMIYLSLIQISNYFSVSPGKDVGGGIYKYTVGDDGTPTYTGTIANPGTGSVSVTWVSGSEVLHAGTLTCGEADLALFHRSGQCHVLPERGSLCGRRVG